MREVLFRGKRTDNGEWVYGYLLKGNLAYIVTDADMEYMVVSLACTACMELVEVIPETVGQFTGLTDKNGKKIFEGDVFATKCSEGVITFKDDYCTFGFQVWWKGFPDYFATFKEFGEPYFEVIGNIHDNPELLKGRK